MSVEGGAIGGATGVASAATGAVGVSIGTISQGTIGASTEIGRNGVGFDNGSPTFSGLERSGVSMPGFRDFSASGINVQEGPVRGDIFNESRVFVASPNSVNEGPVPENITINQNLNSKPAFSTEPVSIFDNTSPLEITMPVNESPVSLSSLKDTFVIANAPELVIEGVLDQPEINVECTLESHLEVSPETVTQAVEDLKITEISNSAIDTAVERSGLIQEIEEGTDSTAEDDGQTETEPENVDVRTDQAVDSSEETDDLRPMPDNSDNNSFVRDEEANKARFDNRHQAAEEILKVADGEIVEGEDIVVKIVKTESEQSGLAKKIGVDDGSIPPADEIIKKGRVKNIQEADNLIYQAVKDNTGVTEGTSGPRATDGEKARVAGKNLAKAA